MVSVALVAATSPLNIHCFKLGEGERLGVDGKTHFSLSKTIWTSKGIRRRWFDHVTRRRQLTELTELSVTSALYWRRSRRGEIQSDREQIDSLRGERKGPRSCDPEAELLLLLYWIKLHSDWM